MNKTNCNTNNNGKSAYLNSFYSHANLVENLDGLQQTVSNKRFAFFLEESFESEGTKKERENERGESSKNQIPALFLGPPIAHLQTRSGCGAVRSSSRLQFATRARLKVVRKE